MMQSVGDYEYGQSDLIGHGAFALVFKGREKITKHPVAVKQILLKNIPGKLSNIRQKEIAILKDLKHPNIVQLYDYHETSSEIYLIMEFCNGGDLADYLHDKKTLSEDSIRHLSRHIAGALKVIHEQHIIHRDIKPQNLLLSFQTSKTGSLARQFRNATIKLADFGFARYLSGADMAGTLCGSPLYMAPEILLGRRYDSKADMWSTGTILYQCLTGNAPFTARNPHALRRRYEKETLIPRIPTGTSSSLTDLLIRLMKKSPIERCNHDEFQMHSFLQTQTHLQATPLDDSPSLHAKSSPVPIHRPHTISQSGYSMSPRTSPHSGHLSFGSQKGFSSSSGPPSIHTINNSSLNKYYSSPPTNVTDEGFILVGTPGQRGSLSPQSFGSHDSSNGSSSHTPSSYGSLSRLSNLQNPFYQPLQPSSSHEPRSGTIVGQEPGLSHTPPFSSICRLGGVMSIKSTSSSSSQKIQHQITPPYQLTPPSDSNLIPSELGMRPVTGSPGSTRKSLPSSRPGSYSKLSTLVESKHEGGDHVTDHMIDSTDLITPSLLLDSEVLQSDLERLSNQIETGTNNLFDQFMNPHKSGSGTKDQKSTQKFVPQSLNLSQELADIRRKDANLLEKRSTLFHIGDDDKDDIDHNLDMSSTQAVVHIPSPGEYKSISRKSTGEIQQDEITGNEEVFSLEEENDTGLFYLQQAINIANELLRIARTRQGPMLLLSSSMGDSGGMLDHVQRFSEQMVLCVKAAIVIADGCKQYNIENALSSTESSDNHKNVLSEAKKLESICTDKAQVSRELYYKCLSKQRRHSFSQMKVTAERLIFLHVVDMCKQAVLEERNNKREECLRKYRISCSLLKLLHSDAKTPGDRNTLQKYISIVQHKLQVLTLH